MANNKYTYQMTYNVSIPKHMLLELALNDDLNKKDYKILLCLFSELNGWKPSETGKSKDPYNFNKISIKTISDVSGISKKDVKKSIDKLLEFGIIECGGNSSVKNGYRFTF